jgi:hypothetical protein
MDTSPVYPRIRFNPIAKMAKIRILAAKYNKYGDINSGNMMRTKPTPM